MTAEEKEEYALGLARKAKAMAAASERKHEEGMPTVLPRDWAGRSLVHVSTAQMFERSRMSNCTLQYNRLRAQVEPFLLAALEDSYQAAQKYCQPEIDRGKEQRALCLEQVELLKSSKATIDDLRSQQQKLQQDLKNAEEAAEVLREELRQAQLPPSESGNKETE
eukprot:gene934-1260_t